MKMNEVRAIWGVPKATAVKKGIETWFYADPSGSTHGVQFDRTGTVLAITETDRFKEGDESNGE